MYIHKENLQNSSEDGLEQWEAQKSKQRWVWEQTSWFVQEK